MNYRRGLSKFYSGKSKSFANIAEVRNIKELGKSDNPFNKRRRTLIAYNLMFKEDKKKKSGTGLFYSHSNHISMPLLPLTEVGDDDDGAVIEHDDRSDSEDYFGSTVSFRLQQIQEHHPYPNTNSLKDNNVNVNVNVGASSSASLVSDDCLSGICIDRY